MRQRSQLYRLSTARTMTVFLGNVLVVLLVLFTQAGAALDRAILDKQTTMSPHRGQDIVLIRIDDKSVGQLGRWPWSRGQHAQLLDILNEAGAKTVAFDLIFSEPADALGDDAFADAIARHGQVLLPVPALQDDAETNTLVLTQLVMLWPDALFVYSDIPFDADGLTRRVARWVDYGTLALPALPLAVNQPELALHSGLVIEAMEAQSAARHTPRWQPVDPMLVAGMPMPETVTSYSYADVIEGKVDLRVFHNRKVIVGVTAHGLAQQFITPRSREIGESMVGAQLSAVAANEIAAGFGINPAPLWLRMVLALVLNVVGAMLVAWVRSRGWRVAGLLGLLLVVWLLPVWLLEKHHLWVGVMAPLAGIVTAMLLGLVFHVLNLRQRAQRFMLEAQALASGLVEVVVVTNRQQQVMFVSNGRSGLLGTMARSNVQEQALSEVIRTVPSIDMLLKDYQQQVAQLDAGQAVQVGHYHAEIIAPNGGLQPVLVHFSPSRVYRGGLLITVTRDTDHQWAEEKSGVLYDSLTGLASRGSILMKIEQRAAQQVPAPTMLALIALDNFERVNEALGVGEGDRLLVEIARRLEKLDLPIVELARWEGVQYAVLLDDNGQHSAEAIAERLHQALTQMPLSGNVTLHFSVGIAASNGQNASLLQLSQYAERAMRAVRRSGGGRWQVASDDDGGWTRETIALEQSLRHAILDGQLRMYYQPVMDVRTGNFSSMEALIRWHHPQRGLIAPAQFFALAEEIGLEVALGEAALQIVQRDMQKLAVQGWSLPVSVNVSARHFERPDFVSKIAQLPFVQNNPPGSLRIELTETMALLDPEQAGEKVNALKECGVHVALDDFGSGHSSLVLLRTLHLYQVKIDRSFVVDADNDSSARALVQAIIHMGQALGLQIVCEGVETVEQSKWLAQAGCYLQQGFLYARPTAIEDLADLLDNPPAIAFERSISPSLSDSI